MVVCIQADQTTLNDVMTSLFISKVSISRNIHISKCSWPDNSVNNRRPGDFLCSIVWTMNSYV